MQPFNFISNYCCLITFVTLYCLMFVAFTSGSVMYETTFGFGALFVMSVREKLVNRMVIFTDAEVEEINAYQRSGTFHPLTCANGHGDLVATNDGLICPTCEYRQIWVPGWIKNGDWNER